MTTHPPLLSARWLVPVLLWIGFAVVGEDAPDDGARASGEPGAGFAGVPVGVLPSSPVLRVELGHERGGTSAQDPAASGDAPGAHPPIPLRLLPAYGELLAVGTLGASASLVLASVHPPPAPPLRIG